MQNSIDKTEHEKNEISLVDFLLIFTRQKKVIIKTIIYFAISGIIIAILLPHMYSTQIKIIPEINSSSSGYSGALSSLRSMGLNIGESGNFELSMESYPVILKSQYVLFQLLADSFEVSPGTDKITVQNYLMSSSDWRSFLFNYTIGLPKKIINFFSFREDEILLGNQKIRTMTQEEEEALKILDGMIDVDIDYEVNLISLTISAKDPIIAKILANKLLVHLTSRVRSLHIEKSIKNVQFLRQRLQESKEDLEKTETDLAKFVDENLSLQSATSKVEIERRQRQVNFNEEIYSELQNQLTAAEIEHQRSIPVLSIIDNPVPSRSPSAPGRKLIVILITILGFFFGIIIAFIKGSIDEYANDPSAKAKIEELKDTFNIKEYLAKKKKSKAII